MPESQWRAALSRGIFHDDEMVCISAVQCGSHVLTEPVTWSYGATVTEEPNFQFYLVLSSLNSRKWLWLPHWTAQLWLEGVRSLGGWLEPSAGLPPCIAR